MRDHYEVRYANGRTEVENPAQITSFPGRLERAEAIRKAKEWQPTREGKGCA